MKVVLKTNNWVEMGWAQSVLGEAEIKSEVFDRHASIVEGSIGAIPRRLMVSGENFARAERVLAAARAKLDAPDADA
jgi:hypothetical protein